MVNKIRCVNDIDGYSNSRGLILKLHEEDKYIEIIDNVGENIYDCKLYEYETLGDLLCFLSKFGFVFSDVFDLKQFVKMNFNICKYNESKGTDNWILEYSYYYKQWTVSSAINYHKIGTLYLEGDLDYRTTISNTLNENNVTIEQLEAVLRELQYIY